MIKTDEHPVTVDEEMADTARVSIDYRLLLIKPGTDLDRGRGDPGTNRPALDAGGIVDFAAWDPERAFLDIVDHKGGRGYLVEAINNSKMRSYGLGWLRKHQDLHVAWGRLISCSGNPAPRGTVPFGGVARHRAGRLGA